MCGPEAVRLCTQLTPLSSRRWAHAAELTPTVRELPRLADTADLNKNLIPAQWNQICGSCLTSVCRKPAVSWSSLQKSYFFTQISIKYDLSAGAEIPFQ